MGYAETKEVEQGLKFKTRSGLLIKTTGVSLHVPSHNMYVHEVEILEGQGQGKKFLSNLDYAEPQ